MPRSRSRSPRRERKHSKERRRHRKSRSRSPSGRRRSRSPRHKSRERYRSRSPGSNYRHRKDRDNPSGRPKSQEADQLEGRPPPPYEGDYVPDDEVYEIEDDDDDDDDVDDAPTEESASVKAEAAMMKAMGFASFDSTKGKKVKGNDIYVANTARKRRYRQYMNRRGGFNRPLDFIA